VRIIDTHAHIDLPEFKGEHERVIRRAREAEVVGIVNVGFDLVSSNRSISLAKNNDFIWATVGIHPHEAKSWDQKTADMIKVLAKEQKVVGLGEIGLDFYRNLSEPDIQRKCFIEQLELAKELDLPIVIHNRDASGEVMRIIEEHKPKKLLLHCFSGDMVVARWAFEKGYLISFGGSLTYPKNEWLEGIAMAVPSNLILVETDCPYLSPVPLRGRRNEPSYIRHTLIKLANIRKVPIDEIAEITTQNAIRFFGLELSEQKKK